MDFDFKIKLTDIGPHSNTELSSRVSSINMALYADNGSGKSFISKSFKRVTDLKYLDKTNSDKVNDLIEKSSAMVRFGKNQGLLTLSIKPEGEPQKELAVKFGVDSLPEIIDTTGLIFHVFNSEYVRENLEAVKYHPEDKVSGFILGKASIDLSKEKEQLVEYENKEKNAIDAINILISAALKELRSVGVQTNTKEYIEIKFENISKGSKNSEKQTYSQLLEKYNILKSMPETIPDISYRSFIEDIDTFIYELENANSIIEHEYSLSSFSDEFKKRFKENQTFIESGLQLSDGEKCPFCGQRYNDNALSLIDDYNAFLKDEESRIIRAINNAIARISSFSGNLSANSRAVNKTINEFEKVKKYFPSFSDIELSCIDISPLEQIFSKICVELEEKKQKVSLKGESIKSYIDQVRAGLKAYKRVEATNIERVKELNLNKNNINSERLRLRKALCNARFNQIVSDSKDTREEFETVRILKEKLSREIDEKESQVRIDKRKKLIERLKYYLAIFFADKYDFDEEHFCVVYQDRALIENTDYVLSDGEKSILAFCFFLANIHGIVEKESDYNKLFLVIDDPVSSMDFNYVYNVAQAIRNIKKEPDISRVRFLILTHNMEFMSILVRNKIVSKKFIMSNGIISDFKNDYVMPYTANLLDIYNVSTEKTKPSHTIPNQIRHILETTYRFEGSAGNFDDYILKNEIIGENGYLYSLIEDHSHGGLRTSKGYTEDSLVDCCKTVVDFISSKYPGQVEEVKKLSER